MSTLYNLVRRDSKGMDKSTKPISSEDTETKMAKIGSPEKVSTELGKGKGRQEKTKRES